MKVTHQGVEQNIELHTVEKRNTESDSPNIIEMRIRKGITRQ